jgi:FkbM family methyltransferase
MYIPVKMTGESMTEQFKTYILNMPIIGILARWLKRKIDVDWPWAREKKKILLEASLFFKETMSLDVSRLYGTNVFHNKGNSLVKRKDYEPDVQQALMVLIGLDKLRNDQSVFADIGVNIGIHTFYIKSQYPDLSVICFDPSPSSWKYFELSVKYNNILGIQLEPIALADQDGELDFYNWGEESSGDSLKDTKRVHGIKPNIIKVPVKKLDDVNNSHRITVVKMDCEGAEFGILKGAKRMISKSQPLILLEFHIVNRKAFSVSSDDIFTLLDEICYEMYDINFKKMDKDQFESSQLKYNENYILLPIKFLKSSANDAGN